QQLVGRHVPRLEDDVLAVVERPVLRQDAVLCFQAPEETGRRKRYGDGISRQVDARLHDEVDGPVERLERVGVEAEDKAAHDRDPAIVDAIDDQVVVAPHVEALPGFVERLLIERLEADSPAAAPGAGRQVERLPVPGDGRRPEPGPAHLQRDERREQLACVCDVGDQVEIEKDHTPRAHLTQIGDDVSHRLLERPRAPRRGHDAEVALEDASAGRLDRVAHVDHAALVQIAAREWQAVELQTGALVVPALQPAAKSRSSCGHDSSAYPTTTLSAWRAASSGTSVGCTPPRTTGVPRIRNWRASSYARGAVPVMAVMPTRSASMAAGSISSTPS